jgi:acyl-CoA synthetase (NDP forming)
VIAFEDVDRARAAAALGAPPPPTDGASHWLRPGVARELLAAYGIAMPAATLAFTAEEAMQAALRIGFPVAVKLASDRITHKSDVGGVILDLTDAAEVGEAFTRIEDALRERGQLGDMAGVTVQAMAPAGAEAIVGVTLDPSFGPLVMFGLGGIMVELLRDVVFRVHPLTDRDAHDMVRSVRGYPLLEGFRGAPPGDVAALETALLRVSQLIADHPEIVEMDLNPLRVLRPGHGCVAVDARIAVRHPKAPA